MRMASLSALCCAAACKGDVVRSFPDEIEPLEPNLAQSVPPESGQDYPEGPMNFSCGKDDADGYSWCHAKAWIQAPLSEVYPAARDPETNVDRREVAEWSAKMDVQPEADWSFELDITVKNIVTVQYQVVYAFEIEEGDEAEPERVEAVFDTVEGSNLLEIYRGSIVLRAETPEVTEVEYIQHLKAPTRDEEQVEQTIRDWYGTLRAATRGEPLPTY